MPTGLDHFFIMIQGKDEGSRYARKRSQFNHWVFSPFFDELLAPIGNRSSRNARRRWNLRGSHSGSVLGRICI